MTRLVSSVRIPVGPGILLDGVKSYVSLGTMGNFGSNLANGFYAKFTISTVSTAFSSWGRNPAGTSYFLIGFNASSAFSLSAGRIAIEIGDGTGKIISAATTNTSNFNNGNIHTIEIIVNVSTQTVIINIDNVSQAITYGTQTTPVPSTNFENAIFIGARNNGGTPSLFSDLNTVITSLLLGTSPSTLYGNYALTETSGNTLSDTSGNSNNGTLNFGLLLNTPRISSF